MKKIIACVLSAAIVLLMLNALHVDSAKLEKDSVQVDDPSVTYDQQALFEELFDPQSVVDISINISKEQIADIQQDFTYYRKIGGKSTTYRIADSVTFTVNGRKYVIEDVGVRMKGAQSRCNFYNDILGIYNLLNLRLSFCETFDDMSDYKLDTRVWNSDKARKQRQKRTFATMKSMELKWNASADNTYIRNIYVNEVFRANGIPVQRCHLSSLSLGGCSMGVYRIFEPVDKDFIQRYFPEEDWGGDLYTATSTDDQALTYKLDNTYGVTRKQKAELYNFNLKTNQSTSRNESLLRLLKVINQPGATKADYESVVDMDQLALFTAINFAMGNIDDMRINYNNHYIYFRKSDGKAVFIPYDCELVMGDLYSWSLRERGMTELSPYYDGSVYEDFGQLNPLMQRTVLQGSWFEPLYTDHLREIAASKWMDFTSFRSYYDPIATHYSEKVLPSYSFMSTMHMNTAFSLEGGEQYNGNMSVAEFLKLMKDNLISHIPQNTEE